MAFTKEQLDAYIQALYDDDGQLSSADYQLIINYILSNGEPETDPRDLIQIRRGDEADLPVLAQGEFGYTLDTNKLFIGGLNGNEGLPNADDLNFDGVNVLKPTSNLTQYKLKNDGTTDNTVNLQALIDAMEAAGGGKLLFPNGTYRVTGTIVLRKNVQLIGVTENYNAPSYENGDVNYSTPVRIFHDPVTSGVDLFVTDTAQVYGYLSGISIKNFDIFGTDNSKYGFDLSSPANFTMENVIIKRFDEGLRVDKAINSRFKQVDIQYCRTVCLRIHKQNTGVVSTATTFENCYLHFTPTPLIIEQESALGIVFSNQTIFESCDNGIDIFTGNVVDFTNCYAENIPRDGSAKCIINLGINGLTESGYARGTCSVVGGVWKGYNLGAQDGTAIFNVDRWAMLTVAGVNLGRVRDTILTSANTKGVMFMGVYEQGITNGVINPTKKSNITVLGANYVGTNTNGLMTQKLAFNGRGKWTVDETFTQTDGDLAFSIDGVKPFWLDGNKNIRHNYSGNQSSTTFADLYGSVARPAFGTMNTAFATWAETINGKIELMGRNSTGTVSPLGALSGTTAERPTSLVNTGACYFDTTLNKPIWKSGTGWVDATGATV